MTSLIHYLSGIPIFYRYLALYPLAVIEGPVFSLGVGFLVSVGYLNFMPAYLMLVLGNFLPDTVYYCIGYFSNPAYFLAKYGERFKFVATHYGYLERAWHNHTAKTLFFSKLAYALSTPLLITAGLARVPYRKFISLTLPIDIVEYAVFMTTGYYLGASFTVAKHYIDVVGIVVAVLAVIFFVSFERLQKYARRKIETDTE